MLLNSSDEKYLLDVARISISKHLSAEKYHPICPEQFHHLKEDAATFVTLKTADGKLRGCIGNLEPYEPLYLSVSHNAVSAAFKDPRFPSLSQSEWTEIKLSISILTKAKHLPVSSEEDLLKALRPDVDGLILEEGHRRATFLPSVWQELQDKKHFLMHLKQKAGLSMDYWSDSIEFYTYQTINFSGSSKLS